MLLSDVETIESKEQHRNRQGNAAALAPYRIKPGEVRNPGGRPRVPQAVKDAARAHTEQAIATLAEALTAPDCPWSARITAAEKLLDRAWGKAEQAIELKGEKRDLLEYSIADLVAIAYQRGMEGGSIEGEVLGSDDTVSAQPQDKGQQDQ